jgi:hypothetical protein
VLILARRPVAGAESAGTRFRAQPAVFADPGRRRVRHTASNPNDFLALHAPAHGMRVALLLAGGARIDVRNAEGSA